MKRIAQKYNNLRFRYKLALVALSFLTALVTAASCYFIFLYWYPPIKAISYKDIGTKAVVETNFGTIEIALDPKNREAVAQFTRYSRIGFYDNTKIHRIVPDLLLEGGDPLTKHEELRDLWGQGGSSSVFTNETHISDNFEFGTVAMYGNSSGTYGSHFIIALNNSPLLKGENTIIGKVINGKEAVTQMNQIEVSTIGTPKSDIVINKITVL